MFVSSYLSCPELAVVSAVLRDGASLVRLYPLPKLVSPARAPKDASALPLAGGQKQARREARLLGRQVCLGFSLPSGQPGLLKVLVRPGPCQGWRFARASVPGRSVLFINVE